LSLSDGGINANYDRGYQVQVCSPDAGTERFALIGNDGQRLKLDASGNAQAACLVRQACGKSYIPIMVTGEKYGHTVRVDSISLIDRP
jgi:hypothetical protein